MRSLSVVEVHDPFQVLRLGRRHIIMIGDHIHIQALELLCNPVYDPSRLIDLVEDAARTSDVLAVSG
jgi:hypothetical protein